MNEKVTEVEREESEGFNLEQWIESKPAAFDRKAEYEEHIEPLVLALHQACRRHGLPFFAVITHTQQANGDTGAACSHNFPSMEHTPPEMLMLISASRRHLEGVMLVASGAMERHGTDEEPAEAPASEIAH